MAYSERERARNAYQKQAEYFKNEMKSELRKYPNIDFNAKKNMKLKAMDLERECLDNYRNDVKGIESVTRPQQSTDLWKISAKSPIKTKNVNVLEFEIELTEGIDSFIKYIDFLTNDNKEKILLFSAFSD